jgi:hypothetical protein
MNIKVESYIRELNQMKFSLSDSMDTNKNVETLEHIAKEISQLIVGEITRLEENPIKSHKADLGKLSRLTGEFKSLHPDEGVKSKFSEHLAALESLQNEKDY